MVFVSVPFLSYGFILHICDIQNIFFRLFVDSAKLSDEVHSHLSSENVSVTVLPYADVAAQLANLVSQGAGRTGKIWVLFHRAFFKM